MTVTDAGSLTTTSVQSDSGSAVSRTIDGSPDQTTYGAGTWASGGYGGDILDLTDASIAPLVSPADPVADIIRFVALVAEVREARAVPAERDAIQDGATSEADGTG